MGVENHTARVVRIGEIRPIEKADNIGVVDVGGYQVVVRKQDWKPGDLAVYIQPDSIVPQIKPFSFLWSDRVSDHPEWDFGPGDLKVPEKYRRITVRKFRGQYSEGLLMPLNELIPQLVKVPVEGDDVAEQIGIKHWVASDPEDTRGENLPRDTRWPRSWRGWLYWLLDLITFGRFNGGVGGTNDHAPRGQKYPVYDVEALKNYKNALIEGEQVEITEKIHGSNGRFVYEPSIFGDGKMYAGSRQFWKRSNCIWTKAVERLPWIKNFCMQNPGYALYGEVVPTQKGFRYGCGEDEIKFFAFDVMTPEGKWLPKRIAREMVRQCFGEWVPVFDEGPYNFEKAKALAEGPSTVVMSGHVREGVVITAEDDRIVWGLGRPQLKIVSNTFLDKDSKL